MKQYWTKNKNGEDVWVTREVASRLVKEGKKKKEDFIIVETSTPVEIAAQGEQEYAKMMGNIKAAQGEQEYAKMMGNIKAAQGGEGLFDQIAKGSAPMSVAEKARTGESSLMSNAYDAASFLPRLAITGYRELGDAITGLAMGAVGGENYYSPSVAKRLSGEDSNVFFDELGNPINYIPMAAAERAGAAIISKAAPKVAETISKLPKLMATARGVAEGAGTEYLSGVVEENATGKTDRSPLAGAVLGGTIGGGLAAGSQSLKKLGEDQVLSEIKIPSRTLKGANAPEVKNLLEYPVEYLPENQKPGNYTKARNRLMRKLTGDETYGTTRNLTGGEVSDILDRISKITGGLVDDRADEIKKIVDDGGYVNLNNVISKVKYDVERSKKYDIAEKKIVLDELDKFRKTEIKTLRDMQLQGLYNDYSVVEVPDLKLQLHPLTRSPFDYALDARGRAGSRAKFENINDPRREKPIADAYGDLYREFNNAIFKPGEADRENVIQIGVNSNIPAENVRGFKSTQEGLAKLVPFENILPARSVVANGRQIVGLPALIGASVGAPIGGVVGSVAGPAGTVAGSLGGAGVGASIGTALTRGSTAGKLMYETGKAIGPKRTLPKIVTPTASRIANEPFRTMYYRDENGNLVETQTNKPLPRYKDVASLPALADSVTKKLK